MQPRFARKLATAVGTMVLVAGCGGGADRTLSAAYDSCATEVDEDATHEELERRILRLADGGQSLIVRPAPVEEDLSSEFFGDAFAELAVEVEVALSYQIALCVLDEVGASEAMRSRFHATRPMDGVQTAAHDRYNYTWSYNPNVGINLTVEKVD